MILVIPMAGRGSRFSTVGYTTPKPLIDVAGKPMLYHAFQSVKNVPYSKVIFIALKEHEEHYQVSRIIREQVTPDFELILLAEVTEGQLCTVLTASDFFREGEGLLVAASDSYIHSDIAGDIKRSDADGIISVTDLPGSHWSFAKTDETGRVTEVAEKNRISNHVSTGLYYFSDSKRFEKEARELVERKETTKGEYYIIPLYNKLIAQGAKIELSHAYKMWDMGTPEAKEQFEAHLANTGEH
jgi:UDP-N-acetylglucosamine diphosphorylase / glucose-1-phosphate thymidylyltransferase / UDP-N-acetylgalactosamine diphosphorylase / glucosamine-1-phosphate N-acetyltransferase / galactosamine-1-phosphate N-acetyltransferase